MLDIEVKYSTCIEEHKLLEGELFKVKEHSANEQKILENEIDILRGKLEDYKRKLEGLLKDNSDLSNEIKFVFLINLKFVFNFIKKNFR